MKNNTISILCCTGCCDGLLDNNSTQINTAESELITVNHITTH